MKHLLLATAIGMAAFVGTANADTVIDDPLHGYCPGCTAQTIGGNDVTVIGPQGVSNFGFNATPPASGDLTLKFLIPDSYGLAAVQQYAATWSVTGTSSSALTLYSTTPWTAANGQFLEGKYTGGQTSYLPNITLASGAPGDPLDAWLGAAQFYNAATTGFYLLTADMGPYSLVTPGQGPSNNNFSLFSLGLDPVYFEGGFIAANLLLANGSTISTAPSGALIQTVSVPGPIVGAGIPGLIAACGGMFGLNFWRKRRNGNTLPA